MREQHKCTIWAKICPEHRVRSKPYNVYVIVDEKAKTIVEAMCTDCPASEGGCKHAVAYLMWLNRRSEQPECTSVECYWKKPRLARVDENIDKIRARDMGCVKKPLKLPDNKRFLEKVTSEMIKLNLRQELRSVLSRQLLPDSEVRQLGLHQLLIRYCHSVEEFDAENFLSFAVKFINTEQCQLVNEATLGQSCGKLWY